MFTALRRRTSLQRRNSSLDAPPSLVVTNVDEDSGSDTPEPSDDGHDASKNREDKSRLKRRSSKKGSRLHIHAEEAKRKLYASRRFLFPLGILLGTIATVLLFPPISLPPQLGLMLDELDISLSLPANITSLTSVSFSLTEWKAVLDNVVTPAKAWLTNRDFAVGTRLRDEEGLTAKHPVVLIPGIVSTGLESWSTDPEYRSYFRKRVWGTTTMIRAVLTEREKWIAALTLDPVTGLDPSPKVKVRAAQGIDAASTFVPGYWIWSKIIENMAVIGYDTNNLALASYDWRLSYGNLEVRDGYFSRLKSTIESFKKRDGKVVLIGHSMGATIVTYFLKWVEAEGHGDGGPDWVENHIEAVVSLAGTHLGVAKAMTAFLSGEMKDTVEINPAGTYVLEKFFSRRERANLFRGWAGSASLSIKGGDAIWGNSTHAPDDRPGNNHTHGQFFSFRALSAPTSILEKSENDTEIDLSKDAAGLPVPVVQQNPGYENLTADAATQYVLEHAPETWQKMMQSNYSTGIERDPERLARNDQDPTKWTNPLEIRLPNAPNMKIVCLYGHGKETERSYWYARGEYQRMLPYADQSDPVCYNTTDCHPSNATVPRPPLDLPLLRENWIDTAVHVDENTGEGDEEQKKTAGPIVRHGVKIGEGDGTVSLISLGAMCVEGWKRKTWNPAGIKVTTIELPHRPDPLDPRGGEKTGEHIDILGSTALNEVVMRVAAGRGDSIEDSYVSDIRDYVKKMKWD